MLFERDVKRRDSESRLFLMQVVVIDLFWRKLMEKETMAKTDEAVMDFSGILKNRGRAVGKAELETRLNPR